MMSLSTATKPPRFRRSSEALIELGLAPDASRDRLRYEERLEDACAGIDFVQECATEREALKVALFARVDASLPPGVLLASSSSALTVTKMQAQCRHPQHVVLGHRFNPPHLMPLVEIAGDEKTSEDAVDRASGFYRALGKRLFASPRKSMGISLTGSRRLSPTRRSIF
jgi:carnitine 3-dehydrogenase